MGEVQAPASGQQKFAARRGHGVKQVDLVALPRQEVGRDQASGPTAHDGDGGVNQLGRSQKRKPGGALPVFAGCVAGVSEERLGFLTVGAAGAKGYGAGRL